MEAKLIQIAKDREITQERDPEFWFTCQRGVLLALKELGLLNEMQCRSAEEILRNQSGPASGEPYD